MGISRRGSKRGPDLLPGAMALGKENGEKGEQGRKHFRVTAVLRRVQSSQ